MAGHPFRQHHVPMTAKLARRLVRSVSGKTSMTTKGEAADAVFMEVGVSVDVKARDSFSLRSLSP